MGYVLAILNFSWALLNNQKKSCGIHLTHNNGFTTLSKIARFEAIALFKTFCILRGKNSSWLKNYPYNNVLTASETDLFEIAESDLWLYELSLSDAVLAERNAPAGIVIWRIE